MMIWRAVRVQQLFFLILILLPLILILILADLESNSEF